MTLTPEQVAMMENLGFHWENASGYGTDDGYRNKNTGMFLDSGQAAFLCQTIQDREQAARKQAASDIFNLAHEYAREDKTMVGSEELRAYHYYNAIHKIGEFDGR